ncbi:MAG TPA: tripartite tricarboxylate transporter substrate binding protein [Alphaproteobacteria bacterium]|nr:tripartite tricarboxylate transporter substrate binding protein [Alphaproteobacteria bacterium]
MSRHRLVLASLLALCAAVPVRAQTYPARPVTLVVPFTPGSGIDIIARSLGQKISADWGEPVVIDNKPGASGGLGAKFVSNAASDGYTLMVTASAVAVYPALSRAAPYDPVRDFSPIARTTGASLALVVNPASLPVTSLDGLIAAAKAQPGKLNYSSPGAGTMQHLAMELVKQELGLDIQHVPYHGAAGALTDLVAGHVDLAFLPVHNALPFASAGKLRMLAVSTPKRSALAPDVPSLAELGHPRLTFALWYGIFGPPKLPPAVVDKWQHELVRVLAMPDLKDAWLKQGLVPDYAPAPELEQQVKDDFARWRAVGQKAGVTLD